MKLNPDCMRDILLCLESLHYNECTTVDEIAKYLPSYCMDDILCTCVKLHEAEFIETLSKQPIEFILLEIIAIKDITYKGHQFISEIREDKIWSGVKSIAGKIGATSLNAFTQIASSVVTELIKDQFGLTTLK